MKSFFDNILCTFLFKKKIYQKQICLQEVISMELTYPKVFYYNYLIFLKDKKYNFISGSPFFHNISHFHIKNSNNSEIMNLKQITFYI